MQKLTVFQKTYKVSVMVQIKQRLIGIWEVYHVRSAFVSRALIILYNHRKSIVNSNGTNDTSFNVLEVDFTYKLYIWTKDAIIR